MSVLDKLQESLQEFTADIDHLYSFSHADYQKGLTQFRVISSSSSSSQAIDWPVIRKADSWTDQNSLLFTYLRDFRSQCLLVGNSIVKMALLVNSQPAAQTTTAEQMRIVDSLLEEVSEHAQTLYNIFKRCLECSLSHALHDIVFRTVRSVLGHMLDLVKAVKEKADKRTIEGYAGMVLTLSEEAQKMPITNKIAYRRFLMEKCLAIKETISEFQGYVDEAGNAEERGVEEEEEDDEFDHDEDERDYTPEEAQKASQCIRLMTVCQDLVKVILGTVTAVGDSLLMQGSSDPDQSSRVYSWIAQIVLVAELMERDCVDLGAELYPPLCLVPLSSQPSELSSSDADEGNDDALVTAYRSLHKNASKTIMLLKEASEIQRQLDNAIVEKIRQEEEKLLTL